ncbi:MAG TPA: hypothetical protein VKA15_21005 [Isosphaeraceae bacterium]|nr:hypothetical protein [Isosphaeraceae bacterium]
MRTRREFKPVVDFMASRISPSVAGLALVIAVNPGAGGHHASPPVGMMPSDTPGSYPIIAGEPTPPGTINC